MSDGEDQEQQEVVKAPPREDPGKRFFISHLNSYAGKTLCQELRNEHLVREPEYAGHTFCGTLQDATEGGVKLETIEGMPSSIDIVSMERT